MMIKKSTTTIFCCKESFISKKKIAFKNFIETFHFVKFSTKENHFYFFFFVYFHKNIQYENIK